MPYSVTELLSSDGSIVCHSSDFEMAPFYNEYFSTVFTCGDCDATVGSPPQVASLDHLQHES